MDKYDVCVQCDFMQSKANYLCLVQSLTLYFTCKVKLYMQSKALTVALYMQSIASQAAKYFGFYTLQGLQSKVKQSKGGRTTTGYSDLTPLCNIIPRMNHCCRNNLKRSIIRLNHSLVLLLMQIFLKEHWMII